MKPINFKHVNKVYAKDQPQYRPLPVLKLETDNGEAIACWKMSLKERLYCLFTGKVWVSLCTFNRPLTPSYVAVFRKEVYFHPDDALTFWAKIKRRFAK